MEDEVRGDYNPTEAKFCASLLWFVCHLGDEVSCGIIPDVTNPIEVTESGTLRVKLTVVNYLTSATLYLVVVRSITNSNPKSFWDLLQVLSQDGIYVIDSNDEPVSEDDLAEIHPFNVLAHLALMDAIMKMHSNSLVTINDVISAIRKFSTFNASKELPFDLEDALILWLNKVNQANMTHIQQQYKQQDKNLARVAKSQLVERKMFPLVTNLQSSLQDGKTLLSIILFYFEEYLTIDSIKLDSTVSLQDCIHNIELFRSLCAEHLCTSVFALSLEDFIYADECLKVNFISLLCEMFYQLEIAVKFVAVPTDEKRVDIMAKRHTDVDGKPHVLQNNYVKSNDQETEQKIKSEDRKEGAIKTSMHQPLLSKRSKQQIAMFQIESQGSNSDNLSSIPVQTVVFENKSQSLDDQKVKSRISLDFRLNSASIRSNLHGNLESDLLDVSLPKTFELQSTNSPLNYNYSNNGVDSSEKQQIPSQDFQYDPRYFAYQTSKSVQQFLIANQNDNNINKEMNKEIQTFDQQKNKNITSLENSGEYNDCLKVQNSDSTSEYIEKISAANSFQQSNFNYIGENDEDDALSTITEATEPDTPSLYSFHSSTNSSTCTLNYNSSTERLDLCVGNGKDYFMDDLNSNLYQLHSYPYQLNNLSAGATNKMKNSDIISNGDLSLDHTLVNDDKDINTQLQVVDEIMKNSYTINQVSVDAAIAAGLPVITKTVTVPKGINSICVNTDIKKQISRGYNYGFPPENNGIIRLPLFQSDKLPSSDDMLFHDSTGLTGCQMLKVNSSYGSIHAGDDMKSICSDSNKKVESADVSFLELQKLKKNDNKTPTVTTKELHLSSEHSEAISQSKSFQNHPASFNVWPFVLKENQNKINGLFLDKMYTGDQKQHSVTTWCELFGVSKGELNNKEIENIYYKLQRSKKRAKFSTKRWIDLVNCVEPLNDENDTEPLSSRLAALRMQLEEKRRQFDEEKKRKQSEWNKEKAKLLQNAFFDVISNGKENQDPNKTIDDCKQPSWDDCFDNVNKKETIPNKNIVPETSVEISNQMKKNLHQNLNSSLSATNGMWFVGVGNENLPNSPNDIPLMTSNVEVADNLGENVTILESSNDALQLSSLTDVSGVTPIIDIMSHKIDVPAILLSSLSSKQLQEIVDENKLSTAENKFGGEQKSNDITMRFKSLSLNNKSDDMLNDNYFTPNSSYSKELNKKNHLFNSLEGETIQNKNATSVLFTPSTTTSNYSETSVNPNYAFSESALTQSDFNQGMLNDLHLKGVLDELPLDTKSVLDDLPLHMKNVQNSLVDNDGIFSSFKMSQEHLLHSVDQSFPKNQALNEQSVNNYQNLQTPQNNSQVSENNFITSENQVTPTKQNNILNDDKNNLHEMSPQSFGFTLEENDMTPEQKKKKERFIQNRMKKLQIEKEKKKAALEKKNQEEEKLAAVKLLQEEEDRLAKEKLKEQRLLDEATALQNKMYNKRLNELTYNTNPLVRKDQLPAPVKTSSNKEDNRIQTSVSNNPALRPNNYPNTESLLNTCSSPTCDSISTAQSAFSEYNGPINYQKPSGKSNKKIIQNAIMHCCLCGEVNKEAKAKCLDTLTLSDASHFLVLFREGLKFRSVYAYNPEEQTISRIYGIGPKMITSKMISTYYKYNSGAKEFYSLDTKHLSIQVDGVMIKKELWDKKTSVTKTEPIQKTKPVQYKSLQIQR